MASHAEGKNSKNAEITEKNPLVTRLELPQAAANSGVPQTDDIEVPAPEEGSG